MTNKEAIKILEKNKPKSYPKLYGKELCQACDTAEVDYDDYKYCPNCGQAIDWSDGRWEDNI